MTYRVAGKNCTITAFLMYFWNVFPKLQFICINEWVTGCSPVARRTRWTLFLNESVQFSVIYLFICLLRYHEHISCCSFFGEKAACLCSETKTCHLYSLWYFKVWTLWDHSFLSYAPDKNVQTNKHKQTKRRWWTCYPRRPTLSAWVINTRHAIDSETYSVSGKKSPTLLSIKTLNLNRL